jgi:hypothetical protein
MVATYSGFHFSGGTGGRAPDMILLYMITTKFSGNKTFYLQKKKY